MTGRRNQRRQLGAAGVSSRPGTQPHPGQQAKPITMAPYRKSCCCAYEHLQQAQIQRVASLQQPAGTVSSSRCLCQDLPQRKPQFGVLLSFAVAGEEHRHHQGHADFGHYHEQRRGSSDGTDGGKLINILIL